MPVLKARIGGAWVPLVGADNSVTNAQLVDMNKNTIKGNNTMATADPKDLSLVEVVDMLKGYFVRITYAQCAAATSTVVTHNFNNQNVMADVYRLTAPFDRIEHVLERTDLNHVTVRFATAPTAAQYQIVVMG